MALITALIPCYNGERYIAGAIESVRAQTRPVDEVLVVDDQSTDCSADIARAAGARVITLPKNAGPSRARNVGLAQARHELVAFLDADDRWTPEHCRVVGGLLDQAPEAVLAFGRSALIQFPKLHSSNSLPAARPIDATDALLRLNPVTQSAVIVRRDVALAAGAYDETMRHSEDYDLWLRLAQVGPFICTHDVTCWREVHPAQASRHALAIQRGTWSARLNAVTAISSAGDSVRVRSARRAIAAAWRHELHTGWRSEFPANLDAALAMRGEHGLPLIPYLAAMAARHVLWRPRQVARDVWRHLRGRQMPDTSIIS